MDYSQIAKGAVYELLNDYGNPTGKLYLVVSDNSYQADASGAIVCMIGNKGPKTDIATAYHVPFDMKYHNEIIEMEIMPEILFNVKQSRLVKYKFTVSDTLLNKVISKIMKLICGQQEMYTLNDAIVKLHNDEQDKKIKYEYDMNHNTHDTVYRYDSNDDYEEYQDTSNLSLEDSQKMFAKVNSDYNPDGYDDTNYDSSKALFFTEGIKISSIRGPEGEDTTNNIEMPSKVVKSKCVKKTKRKKKISKRNTLIYKNKEEFLMDYYTLDLDEVSEKYECDKKDLSNRAWYCREALKKEGYDISVFEDFQKEFHDKITTFKKDNMSKVNKIRTKARG